ncbi:MAG: mechanosensitive ion channel [Clostridiales bacterium]|nr:mechanosensitive ion channel [Clostridiales bacterium]
MNFEELWNKIVSWVTSDAIWTTIAKVIISIIILFVSFKVINVISRKIEKRATKKNADKTIVKTLTYVLRLALKILIFICIIGFLGIDTSGFTALIASLGVCVGLAVNGALSNLAGGVMIILTRPFRVDDYIEAQGHSGTVLEIKITYTKIVTPDNKIIYIPNGSLSSGTVINYSEKDLRRVDLTFSIGYADDFEKAKSIILDVCNNHELILKDPAPFVRMKEHGSSSIDIVTRVWTKNSDYWTVNFDLLETVKKEFDANNIEIPYNQVDVHIKQN